MVATVLFAWTRKAGKGNPESLAQLPCYSTASLYTMYTRHAIIIGERHSKENRGDGIQHLHRSLLLPANRLRSSREEADPASICTIQRKDEFRRDIRPGRATARGGAPGSKSKAAKAKGKTQRGCNRQGNPHGRAASNDRNIVRALRLYHRNVLHPIFVSDPSLTPTPI